MNRRFEEIHGWPREILSNRASYVEHVFAGLPCPAGVMSSFAESSELRDSSTGWEALRVRNSAGHERVINIDCIRLPDQGLFVYVVEDVTERERTHAELRDAKSAAEQASRAKSAFLANISHEIRTPLNGVIGMTELLIDTVLDQAQRDYADTIRRSAETLLALLNDTLDFSKIEAGRLSLEKIDFDLRVTIDEVVSVLGYRAEAKGLEFNCFLEPGVAPFVHGDPGRLRQILINLVGNAVKFTDEGEVVLRVSTESEDENTVWLRFEVSDTGIGIRNDRLKDMFEPFEQGDSSTTRRYGGSGLGLAITKHLVELMDGKLDAKGEPGKGTTFWVILPFTRQSSAPSLDPPAGAEADLAGIRALVVDDNETNRRMLSALLDSWGCRYTPARNGSEAIKLLREAIHQQDPFQVAILDLAMPGIDGEGLARMVKDDPKMAATVLVAMPSAGQRGDAARLGQLGFSGYLPKPVRSGYLRDCLRTVLGARREAPPQSSVRTTLVTRHSIEERRRGRCRVLLAEDSPVNQKVLVALLEKLGCQADIVSNGGDAVRALESTSYDLVLMDCQMPGMDGYETTRRIRGPGSRVRNRAVPVIAVTAHALEGDKEKCLASGMNAYLAKPVTLSALADLIDQWCAKSRHKTPESISNPKNTGDSGE